MTKIVNPNRVSISLLMYYEQCYSAIISYAALTKSGEYDVTTMNTDISGTNMDDTILEAYSSLRGLYYNISNLVTVVSVDGRIISTVDLTELVKSYQTNPEKYVSQARIVH